jgi:hypothetical protein
MQTPIIFHLSPNPPPPCSLVAQSCMTFDIDVEQQHFAWFQRPVFN